MSNDKRHEYTETEIAHGDHLVLDGVHHDAPKDENGDPYIPELDEEAELNYSSGRPTDGILVELFSRYGMVIMALWFAFLGFVVGWIVYA